LVRADAVRVPTASRVVALAGNACAVLAATAGFSLNLVEDQTGDGPGVLPAT
jgi:hypothetical protein